MACCILIKILTMTSFSECLMSDSAVFDIADWNPAFASLSAFFCRCNFSAMYPVSSPTVVFRFLPLSRSSDLVCLVVVCLEKIYCDVDLLFFSIPAGFDFLSGTLSIWLCFEPVINKHFFLNKSPTVVQTGDFHITKPTLFSLRHQGTENKKFYLKKCFYCNLYSDWCSLII